MSDITMEDVTCPHCGAQASFTTYPYVDAAREQELKMRCLNGKVFEFICPLCGKMSHIGYPMCYHDRDQHLMLMVFRDREPLLCLGAMALHHMGHNIEDSDLYTSRAVPTPAHLAEMVDIFTYCLDDRTVELQKHLMMPAIRMDFEESEIGTLLLRIFDDELLYAVVDKKGQVVATMPFEMDAYEELHAKCSPFYSDDPLDNMCIDAKWAEEYFTPDEVLQ